MFLAGAACLLFLLAPVNAVTNELPYYTGFDVDVEQEVPLSEVPELGLENVTVDTVGWAGFSGSTITLQASGYSNDGGYADGIDSAGTLHHARLGLGDCFRNLGCIGPFTQWGGYNGEFPAEGYTTELRIYLDVDYAASNDDVRFDLSSAISRAAEDPTHLRDFVFNAGTTVACPVPGDPNEGEAGFVVSASNNAFRSSTFPSNPDKDPVCIAESGWYTFRHVFSEEDGELRADMTITSADGTEAGSWALGGDPIEDVGGNLYGWLPNQEIPDLPIDEAFRADCLPALGCLSPPT